MKCVIGWRSGATALYCAFLFGCSNDGRLIPIPPVSTHGESAITPPDAAPPGIDPSSPFKACTHFAPPVPIDMSINDGCFREPAVGSLDPVLEWRSSDVFEFETYVDRTNSVTAPMVAQLTDDNDDGIIDDLDTPDVVFTGYDTYFGFGTMRLLSGDGTELHWSADGVEWEGNTYRVSSRGGVAIGDLDGDGTPEIVTVSAYGFPLVFSNDGTIRWVNTDYDVGRGSYPAIADMDGDGRAEIVIGRTIYSWDGEVIGRGEYGTGFSVQESQYSQEGTRGLSFAADVDLDGVMEVVAGDALYRMDGSLLALTGGPDGFPAVGNFDDEPMAEIVVTDGNSQMVILYDFDGSEFSELWRFPVPGAGGGIFNGGPPTVADFDGDGLPEVGVAGSDNYFVIDNDGTFLWKASVEDLSSAITGSSVFDFDRDGAAEVVYADEHDLWILDGKTGAVKARYSDHISRTQLEYPIIADVDGDGQTEIAFVSGNDTEFGEWSGLTVLGSATNSWAPGRKIWNQHAYSVTNVESLGGIPSEVEPSWEEYNTFRAGTIETGIRHQLADLQPLWSDFCLDECQAGRVHIYAQVGNAGLEGAETVQVRVVQRVGSEEGDILREESVPVVSSGSAHVVGPILLKKNEWNGGTLAVEVDPDSLVDECDAENNTIVLEAWPCP